ncbi:hypothetical protein ABH940_004275 [Streptacidiphilus sp. BW17]
MLGLEQFAAISVPFSPPKETRTSPPAARSAAMLALVVGSLTAVTPAHSGSQVPPSVMNARLKYLVPSVVAPVARL